LIDDGRLKMVEQANSLALNQYFSKARFQKLIMQAPTRNNSNTSISQTPENLDGMARDWS